MFNRKKAVIISASEERLENLIRERLEPGSDKQHIDERIWDLFGEHWCVMFTDLSGFSRQVAEFGIIHFLQTIYESATLLIPVIEKHDGILLKTEGDSFLVIFRRPAKALRAAVEMQSLLANYNTAKERHEKVLLCVGLGYGRLLRIGDSDVFGAEVNAASKLGEDIAKAGDILVTANLRAAIEDPGTLQFVEIEEAPPGAEKAYRVLYMAA